MTATGSTACKAHRPVQHRDGAPPWCNECGLTAAFTVPVSRLDRPDRARCPRCGAPEGQAHRPACPYAEPLPRDPMQPGRPFPAPQEPANPRDRWTGAELLDEVARRVWTEGQGRPGYGFHLEWDELDEEVRAAVRESLASIVEQTLRVAAVMVRRSR